MSRVAIRELVRSGVEEARERQRKADSDPRDGSTDEKVSVIVDRLTQLGIVLLDHDKTDLWNSCVDGLLTIFKFGLPANSRIGSVKAQEAKHLLEVIERVMVLGAYTVKRRRFDYAKSLILRQPDDRYKHNFWVRYAVTMISRGNVDDWRKSLIGPSSEYLRTHPEFFGLFEENMDVAVDSMCQFDFFQCVLVTHETGDVTRCYPNFGAYWNHRTIPVVKDLVLGGPARQALGEIGDERLAEILLALDEMAASNFAEFAGWDRGEWEDPEIVAFLQRYRRTNVR